MFAHSGDILENRGCTMRDDRGDGGDDGEEDEWPGGKVCMEEVEDMDASLCSKEEAEAVSYTHLTLPTILLV